MRRENETDKFLDDYLKKKYDNIKEQVTSAGKMSIISSQHHLNNDSTGHIVMTEPTLD